MKSLPFLLKPKSKILLVRKVVGKSMQPTLRPGRLILATSLFRELKPEHIVVVQHQGLEKIKRIQDIKGGRVFLVGDNTNASLDSRSFGWLPIESVSAKVIWPRP